MLQSNELSWRASSSPMTESSMPSASLTTQRSLQRTTLSALTISYHSKDPKHELFHWLLIRADGQDLEKVRGNEWFFSQPSEYQDAVTKAYPIDTSKTRHVMGRLERAAIIQSAIGELVAVVLVKLIAEYEGW